MVADRTVAEPLRTALAGLCLALAFTAAAALPAHATGIVVNDSGDMTHTCATTGTGTCTLRDAITFANSNPGADSITFSISGTITLGSTLPAIDDTLTIDGTGQAVTVSGNNIVRVMYVNSGKTLNLNALTIADANSSNTPGAGIYSLGPLNVTNCTFTDNNSFLAIGGAIVAGGATSITNSTFVGNIGNLNAGAIAVYATTQVTNCTFFDNAGAITVASSFGVTITNSIFAANTQYFAQNCAVLPMTSGSITDGGHNLDDGATCGFTGSGCSTTSGSSFCNTDPQLDPAGLASNGGPTQTLAVCTAANNPASCTAASPAVNAGDEAVCSAPPVDNLDQRGFVRPGGGSTNCTIGAFEANGMPPSPTKAAAPALSPVVLLGLAALLSVAGWRKARTESQAR
jgi:CSLREA domain-containing protein